MWGGGGGIADEGGSCSELVKVLPMGAFQFQLCPQALQGRGETVQWVEVSSLKKDKRYIYVMEDFSSPHYKSLEGICR